MDGAAGDSGVGDRRGELDMRKLDEYPAWICADCGHKHGRWPDGHVATFHNDICGWCGEEKSCTEPRDFGYPKYLLDTERPSG